MIRLLALLLLTCLFTLVGCGEQAAPTAEAAEATASRAGEPRAGGELVIALQADGKTLDPHAALDAGSMHLIENMYSTLMRYTDEYGEIEPDLLASHEVSDDFRTFTLTIRDDAQFHSGRAVTAEDVKYSLERIIEMGPRSEPLANLDEIEVTGVHTLVLRFSEPMSPLMTYLAHPMMAIVDREVVEANGGELDRADAGSGPFKLVDWQKDQRLTLEKDAAYYVDGLPRLERVVYRPIPEDTARTTALANREVDVVLDVPVQDVELLEQTRGVVVASVPGTFWEYVGLNTQRPPFDDARVRQAVAWAVDRAVLNQAVKYGRATVLDGGHIPPHHWAYADLHLYPQRDVAKAKALLAEAGHPEGFSTELIVGADFEYQVQAAGIVKQMLKDAGIEVDLQRLESSMFFERLGQRDFDMTLVGWVGFVDADEWVYAIYHSDGPYNQQAYANSEVDRLLAEGRAVGERDARQAIYRDAQERIATDAPTVFLYVNDQTSAHLDDVGGFVTHPTATTLSLREAWLNR